MLKRLKAIMYFFAFFALCGIFGWQMMMIASEQPPNIGEYQKRLNITAANVTAPADVNNLDSSQSIYAIYVVHSRPFKTPFVGYGIYLGQGLVITAAHVLGRWPFIISHPRVLIAGQEIPAKVIKNGSVDQTDLAVLSVEQERLPVSLRLRRNPLCKAPLQVGTNVVVVYPERTVRSKIISPLLIPPESRMKFSTLINEAEGSGSGVFDAERKCFLGIISREIKQNAFRDERGRILIDTTGDFAGYFVPAPKIAEFIPPEFRF